ncbi:hypothetical protein J1N35_005376 [Gossypium stocksii]|uniref:Uncharacterized protein n=1 Tax=Gossypium stocksii TaxID=47602 RepID=A0A9D3WDP4_9ROSI|nr:hypothetical protein J1N35_005376 [Gossypium stocksii]
MPPRTRKRSRSQPKPPPPLEYVSIKFKSKEVEAFFLSIQGHTFILERGFDPSTSYCKKVWDLVCFHRWMNFALVPTTPIVIPVILEFYSNLNFFEKHKVFVRNKKVDISSHVVSDYYGVPYYESDELSTLDLDKFNNINIDTISLNKGGYGSNRAIPPPYIKHNRRHHTSTVSRTAKRANPRIEPKDKTQMEVFIVVNKKSAIKKTDEPTQWLRRLGQVARYNTRLLKAMKPFMDTFCNTL